MSNLNKYPEVISLENYDLEGRFVIVEEMMDGPRVGVSFNTNGSIDIERDDMKSVDLLKSWTNVHRETLYKLLSDKYIMFGYWMLNKNSIFYDMLPHYFMECDVLEKDTGKFLTYLERSLLFTGTPVKSVAILWNGIVDDIEEVNILLGNSLFKSLEWEKNLKKEIDNIKGDSDDIINNTDKGKLMNGLSIKIEDGGETTDRLEIIRSDFVLNSNNDMIYNRIRPDVNLWR